MIYKIDRPEITETPQAAQFARTELAVGFNKIIDTAHKMGLVQKTLKPILTEAGVEWKRIKELNPEIQKVRDKVLKVRDNTRLRELFASDGT